jgi:glycosyltransferase involved in cell wall biosynthesis
MSKKVSVIVCSYNARDDLKECLESLERQDYSETEVIVVNDASTDGTAELLNWYRDQTHLELVIISSKTNLGVAGSRNVGVARARGEIIAFTDADCIADRSWVSELVRGYENKDVVAVGGHVSDKTISNIWELTEKGHDNMSYKEGYVTYIVGCNMSFYSWILTKYMFNDELKYGYEEALLCDHLINEGHKIYYRPQADVLHRHRSTMLALLRRKYLLGVSSVWYRKKQKKLFMFKRHIILLTAVCAIPIALFDKLFAYFSLFLFFVFSVSLLRDETIFKRKSFQEIVITCPFLIFIELSHFGGSLSGLIRFRVLGRK